jgi:hypothetical protein
LSFSGVTVSLCSSFLIFFLRLTNEFSFWASKGFRFQWALFFKEMILPRTLPPYGIKRIMAEMFKV